LRVVDWLELQQTFPSELKVELKKVLSQDFDGKLFTLLEEFYKAILVLNRHIEMTVQLIKVRASELEAVTITPFPKCCKRGCAVCLGKYAYHYPYFKVNRRTLSTRRLYEFLLRLGLTEEQVRMFDRAVWARHKLMGIYHGLIITLGHMGMTQLKIEVEPLTLKVEQHEG